jgi:aminoglycoside phosphotransferase
MQEYLIISHATRPEVLMLHHRDGWSLPTVVPTTGNEKAITRLNQDIKDQLGIDVTLLRCLCDDVLIDNNERARVQAAENLSLEWSPPAGGHWIGRPALERLVLRVPQHRRVIEEWLTEVESGISTESLAAWERPGWLSMAKRWIADNLSLLGVGAIDGFRQFAGSPAHYLLEAQTSAGKFYFKAVGGELTHEQKLTCFLARLYPAHLPRIAAFDDELHWWLMYDVGGTALCEVHDLAQLEKVLRTFAEIQVDCIAHAEDLLALGCPEYRPVTLAGRIDWFFSKLEEIEAKYTEGAIDKSTIDRHALSRRLKELSEQLVNHRIPPSLVHGDFGFSNIYTSDGACIYIDWAEGYVGNPFDVLALFSYYLERKSPDLKSSRARLRNAYFGPWSGYWSMDQLIQLYYMSRPLTVLRYGIRVIESNLGSRPMTKTMGAQVASYLNILVQRMARAANSSNIEGTLNKG